MKKTASILIVFLLIFAMLLSLVSCDDGNTEKNTDESTNTNDAQTTDKPTEKTDEPTEAPTEAPTETPTEAPTESATGSTTEPPDKSSYKKLVVIGDSISSGYGLANYVAGSSNQTVQNFANAIAKEYDLTYGESFFNLAVDGYKSNDILNKIKANSATLKDADLILVTAGGNDLMLPLFVALADVMGSSISSLEEGAALVKSLMTADEAATEALRNSYAAKKSSIDDSMQALIDNFASNLDKINEEIKKVAPKAKVVIQTIYDPLNDTLLTQSALKFVDEAFVQNYMGKANDVIKAKAEAYRFVLVDTAERFIGKAVICTNIMSFDIHPNAYGHDIIASLIKAGIS